MPGHMSSIAALLLLLALGSGNARHLQQPLAKPDYAVYHRKEVLLQEVKQIVTTNPRIMAMETRTSEDKGYAVEMQVLTVETSGLTANHSSKARLFLDFGEHGREFISAELGLQLLQTLAKPELIKAVVGGGERGEKLMQLLQRVVFKILPLENAKGRDLVEAGKLCERKNGRGVDTNRNWEIDWGKKEKDYDPAEEFPGAGPFSEPEVKIILDIAKKMQPHVWLNVHSGMEAMFTPWDHKAEVASEATEALRILQAIHKDYFTKECVVGSGGKSVGYLAHGTATDYMYERLKVPMPYTWEIYGDMKADFHDCFRMFNPLTKQHVQDVVNLWLKAIFRLVELLPTHPATAPIFHAQPTTPSTLTAEQPGGTTSTTNPTGQIQGTLNTQAPTGGSTPVPGSTPGGTGTPATVLKEQPPKVQRPVVETPVELGLVERPVVQVNPGFSLTSTTLWMNLVLGVAGIAVVAFLVYRYVQKTKTPLSNARDSEV